MRGRADRRRPAPTRTTRRGSRRPGLRSWGFAAAGAALLAATAAAVHAQEPLTVEQLRQMSIDDLADLQVTSVSRQSEPLRAAPAAVYVITAEEIRRYGATSLAEVLRLAPNLHVARSNALSHSVAARGFNSSFASNKLLVMIDGRTIYSPLHSGVFWEAQDVMLADVERIEVVSGPGGTLWGANAVNGVINVVTRSATETAGAVAVGNYGDVDRDWGVRMGLTRGEQLGMRAYWKAFDRGHSINSDGSDHIDGWRRWQVGFRSDWAGEADVLTVQGDLYRSRLAQAERELPDFRGRINGADVLARWTRSIGEGSSLEVQGYYDRTRRDQRPFLAEDVDTWDVSAQHRFALGSHGFVWGTGFRQIDDSFADLGAFATAEEHSRRTLFSVFLQDHVRITNRVSLTAGLKLEDHTYTGLEYMPNVRLALQTSENALWWTAVSRAVRTPSRIDRELQNPGVLIPSPDFASETLLAYEVGFRGQPVGDATVSVSAFFNRFDDLRTTELSAGGVPPAFLSNGLYGDTYGVEIHTHVGLTAWWRLSGGLTAVRKDLQLDPGVTDISNLGTAGNDPSYHLIVRSLMAPLPGVELDVGVRSVEDLDSPAVPGYTLFDARIGWTVLERVDLVGTAFNLFDDSHPEAGEVDTRREIRRSLSVGLRLRS